MKDWIERLDIIISLNGRELLDHAGRISHQQAIEKSSEEYKKFKDYHNKIEYEKSFKELEFDIVNIAKKK